MKGPRPVQTRGWITSADCEGLPSLPVARACPSPRLRTGVTGNRMCAGGTATANSDPREDVRSGQLQHDVKKYIRGHESGDVVGLNVCRSRSIYLSSSFRYTFERIGDITPPCGVPVYVPKNFQSSTDSS